MSDRWPNFLILGAARSGTTALFTFLQQHPQVFGSPRKEPHYFAFPDQTLAFTGPGDAESINARAVTDTQAYRHLFSGAGHAIAVGEASVSYLYYPQAAQNIRQMLDDVRLIVLLRDPVERAFSNFQYMRSMVREPLDRFELALEAEPARIRAGWHHIWHYRQLGFYHQQLSRYYRLFPADRILPLVFEDFRRDPAAVLRQVFDFLGVDPEVVVPTDLEVNISGQPRSHLLARALVRSTRWKRSLLSLMPDRMRDRLVIALRKKLLRRASLPLAVGAELRDLYRPDVEALQDLIDRDLGAWLRG